MPAKDSVENSPLGKRVEGPSTYTPELLYAIPRLEARAMLDLKADPLPFKGVDIWNLYELSWLDGQGKPQVAMGQMEVPCDSPSLAESKSLKLYLNSLNQARFDSRAQVAKVIQQDLSLCVGAEVMVRLLDIADANFVMATGMQGDCLDKLQVACEHYTPEPGLLTLASGSIIVEHLYTDLFRSHCPVTGQPDWGSVALVYRGLPICKESLLKYLVSFRQHGGFHEQCVEQIFIDIMARCRPEQLTVSAQFLRRGGIDINPVRSTGNDWPELDRLIRQ